MRRREKTDLMLLSFLRRFYCWGYSPRAYTCLLNLHKLLCVSMDGFCVENPFIQTHFVVS